MTSGLNIVAFVCENHAMDSLRAASSGGETIPETVQIVQLPCTGRLETTQLLDSIRSGADGVVVIGCLEENCYHDIGSRLARGRVERIRQIMSDIGFEAERVEMINSASVSSSILLRRLREFEARLASLPVSPLRGAIE